MLRPVKRAPPPKMFRLYDPGTGNFLHWSGEGTTARVDHSWLGHYRQAENLRQIAERNGEDWPFVPVHRSELEAVG